MSYTDTESDALLDYYRHANRQLVAVNQLIYHMISMKDPKKLLTFFCEGIIGLLNVQFGLAGIFDSQGNLRYFAGNAIPAIEFDKIKALLTFNHPWIGTIVKHASAFVCHRIDDQMQLPLFYEQPIDTLIAVPLVTKNQLYGFAYFMNKTNQEKFNDMDLQVVDSVAAIMSISYENIELYRSQLLRFAQHGTISMLF